MDKNAIKNYKGFTLIELLVVIAIIAILATIGFVAYSQANKVARDGKRIEDMQAIQKAIETYRIASNTLPGYVSGADQNITLSNTTPSGFTSYFQGNNVPTDPIGISPNIYKYYTCGSDPTKYVVCAQLENCGSAPNSKCNVSSNLSSACSVTLTPGSGTLLYCLTN